MRLNELIDREPFRKTMEKWRDDFAKSGDEEKCGLIEDVIFELNAQPNCKPYDYCSYGERREEE